MARETADSCAPGSLIPRHAFIHGHASRAAIPMVSCAGESPAPLPIECDRTHPLFRLVPEGKQPQRVEDDHDCRTLMGQHGRTDAEPENSGRNEEGDNPQA